MQADNFDCARRVYGWSFYSQGTKDTRQVSADSFINAAFKWFEYPHDIPKSGHEKGVALADWIGQSKSLLILDGLEPMQFPPGEMGGKLKDSAMSVLLKNLANANQGLCIVTSRITIDDLKTFAKTTSPVHSLDNLSVDAGVQLLKNAGITGPQPAFEKTVTEVKGHALALNLLGSYLAAVHDGDIRKRDTIQSIYDDEDNGSHAKNVMVSYQKWFAGEDKPELDILTLLGLFDRPADVSAIEILKSKPAIPGISERLQNLTNTQWKFAIKRLQDLNLLATQENKNNNALDCHPLIREYFSEQLQQQNSEGFKAAHGRLYEYYKNLPSKELPDTLEEMEPLFIAVNHGCLAGKYQETHDDVLFKRIRRKKEFYILYQLGAFDSFISILSNFFVVPWHTVQPELASDNKTELFNQAGFALRAVGRLFEAVQPLSVGLELRLEHEYWPVTAVIANNLSELYLLLGKLVQAVSYGEQSVTFADKSGEWSQSMKRRATHADALHQAGQYLAAERCFIEAEQMQQKHQPYYPYLHSVQGFRYCDLLLGMGEYQAVLKRAKVTLELGEQQRWLLDIALDQLILANGLIQQVIANPLVDLTKAEFYCHEAVSGLREAGTLHHLPRGLFTRAKLYRQQKNYIKAWTDLDEAREVASHGPMLLHLTDYYLAACHTIQVQLDDGDNKTSTFTVIEQGQTLSLSKADMQTRYHSHLVEATTLVKQTGYHRRDKEVEALTAKSGDL
jgi:tetratricopeptide (TPR) repeat protein